MRNEIKPFLSAHQNVGQRRACKAEARSVRLGHLPAANSRCKTHGNVLILAY